MNWEKNHDYNSEWDLQTVSVLKLTARRVYGLFFSCHKSEKHYPPVSCVWLGYSKEKLFLVVAFGSYHSFDGPFDRTDTLKNKNDNEKWHMTKCTIKPQS